MTCANCKDDVCQNKCKPKFPYRFPPMSHQRRALKRMISNFKQGFRGFGLLHAMGAGKTFTAINGIYYLAKRAEIGTVLIICPTAIKNVWATELKKCMPDGLEYSAHVLRSGGNTACNKWMDTAKGLKILVVGVEALSQGSAKDVAAKFIKKGNSTGTMTVVDESSRIKNAQAGRTKTVVKFGAQSDYRIVMTGTPVTQGLHDLYAQMQFLDPKILSCKSYVLFRNMYCIMGGFEGRKIIGYQRSEELLDKIRPFVDIVTKEEALPELPPKTYERIEVDITPQQRKAMKSLEDMMYAEQNGMELTVQTVMDRLTRFQQIIGGHFPHEDAETGEYKTTPIEGKNPKIDVLMDLLETNHDAGVKTIIWARFTAERNLIMRAIEKRYGSDYARLFDGQVPDSERGRNTEAFQSDGDVRVMVANVVVGGMGQTWTAATHEIYYSNDFSYENRMQSEDRAHRKGQKNAVKYTDIVANVKADKMITAALLRKADVAEMVKDNLNEDLGAKT